jgi:hypothetical protein
MREEMTARMAEAIEVRDGKRTIPVSGHLGPVPNRLAFLLSDGKPGDEFTDDELSTVAGVDCGVGGKGRSAVYSAVKHVRGAHDTWWRRVAKEGLIRCLDAAGRVGYADGEVRHIGRTARRAVKAVSLPDVPQELVARRDVVLAQVGAIATLASAKTLKRLTGETKKAPKEIGELKALVEALGA